MSGNELERYTGRSDLTPAPAREAQSATTRQAGVAAAGTLALTSIGTAALASAALLTPGVALIVLLGLGLLTMATGVVVLSQLPSGRTSRRRRVVVFYESEIERDAGGRS